MNYKLQTLSLSLALLLTACGGNFTIESLNDKAIAPTPHTQYTDGDNSADNNDNHNTTASSQAPAALNKNNCQSETLCVHSSMPLYSQADGSTIGLVINGQYQTKQINVNAGSVPLLKYVQNMGHNITKDPGWCGAVSFTMALKTWAIEAGIQESQLNSTYKWILSSDSSEVIYNVMGFLGMKPELGVSAPEVHNAAFNKLVTFSKGTSEFSNDMPSPSDYRDTKKNPIMTIGLGSRTGGGHLLAVNGTDAQYYVINDPWGATYSINYVKGTTQKTKPNGSIYYDYAFSYVGSGIKLLEDIPSGFIPSFKDINGLIGVSILSNYR